MRTTVIGNGAITIRAADTDEELVQLQKEFMAKIIGGDAREAFRCDWDPEKNAEAYSGEGCPNEAVLSVGSKDDWWLCEECAALPAFSRYKRREPLW